MPNFLNICSESSLFVDESFRAEAKLNLTAYDNWADLPPSLLFMEGIIQFSARFIRKAKRVKNPVSILPVQLNSIVLYKPIVFDNYCIQGTLKKDHEDTVFFEAFSCELPNKINDKVATGNIRVKLMNERMY